MDKAFLIWYNVGLKQFQDLYHNWTLSPSNIFVIPLIFLELIFFCFFQIRNFIRNMSPIFPRQPTYTSFAHILDKPSSFKGITSITYSALTALWPSSISESELGEPICDASWETALSRVHGSSICARHGLLQFKILHRIHWTKLRLSKRFSDANPQCDRCKLNPASHTYVLVLPKARSLLGIHFRHNVRLPGTANFTKPFTWTIWGCPCSSGSN